jgi:hypothetical protein
MPIPATAVDQITRATVLLEAVARHCEHALDGEVPLRCGRAAGLLHRTGVSVAIPTLPDEPGALIATMTRALNELESLPPAEWTGAVLDAHGEIRTALQVAESVAQHGAGHLGETWP